MGKKRYYQINQYITAKKVRLIDQDGKQFGVVPIGEAREKARQARLDLIEVASNIEPPVVKIDDFRTFLGKRLPRRRGRRNSGQDLKEIRLKPFVGTHDLDVKLSKMDEFLGEGNKVKVTISFFGRAIAHKHLGKELMDKIIQRFEEKAKVEAGPNFKGRRLFAVFVPKK